MEAPIRRRLSTAQRALDFANAHPLADTGFTTVLARLSAAVARGNALGMQQTAGQQHEQAAIAQRETSRTGVREMYLRRLVNIGSLAAVTNPDLAGQFVLPPLHQPNKSFILSARVLLAAAIQYQDILLPLGLGPSFIADLIAALDRLDAATVTAHSGRSDHVGARADLIALARECRRDVAVLGTYFRVAYANDADLLAGWASATNIAGPFERHDEVPAPDPVPPAPAPVPADPAKTA